MPKLVEFCVKRSFSGCNTVYQLGFTRLIHTIRCKNLCRNTYVYVHISVDGQLYILVLVLIVDFRVIYVGIHEFSRRIVCHSHFCLHLSN